MNAKVRRRWARNGPRSHLLRRAALARDEKAGEEAAPNDAVEAEVRNEVDVPVSLPVAGPRVPRFAVTRLREDYVRIARIG
jgi:hypothetical protein